jgi:hypothetical protein
MQGGISICIHPPAIRVNAQARTGTDSRNSSIRKLSSQHVQLFLCTQSIMISPCILYGVFLDDYELF